MNVKGKICMQQLCYKPRVTTTAKWGQAANEANQKSLFKSPGVTVCIMGLRTNDHCICEPKIILPSNRMRSSDLDPLKLETLE